MTINDLSLTLRLHLHITHISNPKTNLLPKCQDFFVNAKTQWIMSSSLQG